MKTRIKTLFIGLAVFGFFAIGITSLAEEPLCRKGTALKPDDYETYDGGLCKCNGDYTGGGAEYCRRILNAGTCHEFKCNNVACCLEEPPPA